MEQVKGEKEEERQRRGHEEERRDDEDEEIKREKEMEKEMSFYLWKTDIKGPKLQKIQFTSVFYQ